MGKEQNPKHGVRASAQVQHLCTRLLPRLKGTSKLLNMENPSASLPKAVSAPALSILVLPSPGGDSHPAHPSRTASWHPEQFCACLSP